MPPQMDELLLSIDGWIVSGVRWKGSVQRGVGWIPVAVQHAVQFAVGVARLARTIFTSVCKAKDFQSVESSERTKLREALETVKAAMGAQAYVPEFCFFQ